MDGNNKLKVFFEHIIITNDYPYYILSKYFIINTYLNIILSHQNHSIYYISLKIYINL